MIRLPLLLLGLLIAIFAPVSASAQVTGDDTTPGAACSPEDAVRVTANPSGTGGYVLTCEGGVWVAQLSAATPTANEHVATKAYVDAAGGGLDACVDDDTTLCGLQTSRATNDPDLIPSNIRSGVNILGVTGIADFSTVPATCPNVGDTCSDGSVYAGTQLVTGYRMYVTPADSGNYQYQTSSTGVNGTVANYGRMNTKRLHPAYSAPAAAACANLSAHTHTDWFLPAPDELEVLYNNRSAIGGFSSSVYWSSRQSSSSYAYELDFSNGNGGTTGKSASLKVRCVRYEECHIVGMDCQDGTVYAGQDSGYDIYTTPADQTPSAYWGTYSYTTGVGCCSGGPTNHTTVHAHVVAGDGSSNPDDGATPNAFVECEDLIFGGHTDWYLPSYDEVRYELGALYSGGWDGVSGSYWTSAEDSSTTAYVWTMGGSGSTTNKDNTRKVRCVRRE